VLGSHPGLPPGHAQTFTSAPRGPQTRAHTSSRGSTALGPRTEQASAASRAEAVRQNLVTVLDASDDAITTCSLDGVFVTWNRGAENLYGYSAHEAIGQPLDLIVPPQERGHEHSRWQRLLTDDTVKSLETKRTTKDGRTVDVSVTRSLIVDPDGTVVGVASVGRDITEIKRAQTLLAAAHAEAVKASQMKSQFIANMNHELRTPLNGVIGISRLLLDTELTLEQREYADALRISGEALLGVIGDILDFSKVEAGKLELVDEVLGLHELVHGVCAMVGLGTAAIDAVRLAALIEPDLPAGVWGDKTRLRQVLTNLASNAVKFTPQGEVTISVRRHVALDGAPKLRFEVADTGIGIAPDAQETIFESFAQADGSTTRRYGGTGLGLAIARQLVTLMGGSIGVRSALGDGSTFWFMVPLRPAAGAPSDAGPAAADAPALAGTERGEPRRILVAEDNPVNQLVTRRLLEQRGFHVDIAADGREAVEMHARASYDLIFMDCQMPELDGYDATRAIRAREGVERRTPVVALTASTMAGDTKRCFDAGMDRFAAKPIRPADLDQLLAELLGVPAAPAQ
jgi:two-component system sensor histidine kinase/response regulator